MEMIYREIVPFFLIFLICVLFAILYISDEKLGKELEKQKSKKAQNSVKAQV